MFYQFNQV